MIASNAKASYHQRGWWRVTANIRQGSIMGTKSRQRPPRASPPSKRQYEQEWGSKDDDLLPEPAVADEELPGVIFAVPDHFWGFEAVGREDHPGICTACYVEAQRATLVKGRDAVTDRGHPRHRFVVQPSDSNGLKKATSFELIPLDRSLRRVRLLHPERQMGTLEPELFDELRKRLIKLFPPEEP